MENSTSKINLFCYVFLGSRSFDCNKNIQKMSLYSVIGTLQHFKFVKTELVLIFIVLAFYVISTEIVKQIRENI